MQARPLDLNPGALCPQCATGKVYNSPPRTLVKMKGQAPIAATVYELMGQLLGSGLAAQCARPLNRYASYSATTTLGDSVDMGYFA